MIEEKTIKEKIAEIQTHIERDDFLHQYWFDGKETISTTQLLKKQNISPDYSTVSADILREASERGSIIHKDIELSILNGSEPITDEGKQYFELLKEKGLKPVCAEFFVGNNICCGECDTLLIDEDNNFYIDDHKTGAVIHTNSVRWQGTIYAYLMGIYDYVKGIYCSHLPKTLKGEMVLLEKIPLEKIEKLFNAERNGEIYKEEELAIPQVAELQQVEQFITDFEIALSLWKAKEDELKKSILAAMQDGDVWKFETDNLTITRVKASFQERIDTARIKKEQPELFEKYKKIINVSESLRIKIGGNKDDNI